MYDLPKNYRIVNFDVMKSEKSFRPVAKFLTKIRSHKDICHFLLRFAQWGSTIEIFELFDINFVART